MGSGKSKQQDNHLGGAHNQGRRRSHVDTNPPPQSDRLIECRYCGRNFASDRIDKHQNVCKKTANSRRPAFDVQGQRLEGTEAEEWRDEINDMDMTRSPRDWKRDHERMIRDMKKDRRHARPDSALDNIEFHKPSRGRRY